jgi:hypothetical protein
VAKTKADINNPRDVRLEDYLSLQSIAEKLKHLIAYAVLAPSTHNTQPWLFRLSDKTVDVLADRSRALPVIDPEDKSLVMSCGAATGVLATALEAVGFQFHLAILPDPAESDLVARIHILGETNPTPDWEKTLNAIRHRRTVRSGFKDKGVHESELELILASEKDGDSNVILPHDVSDEANILRAVIEADHIRRQDKHFLREYASWIHPIRSRSRDGIPEYSRGLLTVDQIWSPDTILDDNLVRMTKVAVIVSNGNKPMEWTRAGIRMGKTLVQASKAGLNAAVINHPLAIPEIRSRIESILETTWTAQILLRFGYAERAPYTLRRPLNDVMLHPGFTR